MGKEELITPELMLDERYFAHTRKVDGQKQTETLLAHSTLTYHYYEQFCKEKGIKKIIERLITVCGFSEKEKTKVYLLFVHAIYLHDLGKINPRYQYNVLDNNAFRDQCNQSHNANHALASAYMYTDHMYKILGKELTPALKKCVAVFAYCISKHHGKLGDGHNFSDLENWAGEYYKSELDDSIFEEVQFYMQDTRHLAQPVAFYILCRLLYALITGCDYCATQEFMTGSATKLAVVDEGGRELGKKYENSEILCSIRQYQQDPTSFCGEPINALRNQLFLEAEQSLLANPDAHIYYLEAPTGAGKTNIAINLSLRVLQMNSSINNIFYVFPFNTLVEQTKNVLYPYFGDNMAVINSITPVLMGGDNQKEDYDAAWLDHIFNNYPIVVTSHINFFNALFGCGRDQCFPLLKLCNSVVIIDEIQSYRNDIWREIISFLQNYAKLLNIKIIIMSATLPQLDKLLKTVDAQFTALIRNPSKYYQHPLFRDRVRLDFSLLEKGKITWEELKEQVGRFSDRRVLVEFINKKTAREFYQHCKDDYNVVLLTGDDNAVRREQIIQRIKSGERLILIATQVIEAGIDIDMEIGFKDISLLDAEEQFLGRINRSCLNPGKAVAYFFDYDDPAYVYKKDARLHHSIQDPAIRKCLQEKNFAEVYAKVFEELISRTSKANEKNLANLDKNCGQLNCQVIEQQMQLLEHNWQIFVPYVIDDLDGYQVWKEFKELGSNRDMSYAQRMIEYSKLALQISYFTFQVQTKDKIPAGAEEYGGYYFIDGGERFIEDGILNREALEKYYGGIFV